MNLSPLPRWAADLSARDLILLEQGFYTVPALAARLCRSERYVYDLLRSGELPGRRHGNRWIARAAAVERFLDSE